MSIIEEQLKKCQFADLTNFDEATNTYHISKYAKPIYTAGCCYLIKLPGELIKNPTTILAVNWNHGTAPQHEYYKAYVNKTLGKMIYCDCLAYDFENRKDLSIMFSGWFDTETLTQIAKL